MIYWLVILIFLLMLGISKRTIRYASFSNSTIEGKKIYITIATIILVCIAGFRSVQVGNDTSMYKMIYGYMQSMSSFTESLHSWQTGSIEPGYNLIQFIFSRFADFQVFIFVLAIVSVVPVMIVIYRYSKDYWMSLFLYISFGFFSFAMNGLRQAVAIGICMIAYIFAKEKHLIKFLICIVLAMTVHMSAIVFVPTYWLSKIKFNKKTIIIYLVSLILANVFKSQLFRFVNLFGRQIYASTNDAGGVRMYLFMLGTVALIYVYRKNFLAEDLDDNTTLLSMFAISTLIWPLASANAAMFRLYYYYQIFMTFCIPSFLHSQRKTKYSLIFYGLFLLVGCYFLQFYIIGGDLKYYPYTFFWEV